MPKLLQTLRAKAPSARAMLAMGGAAAVAVGIAATSDTLAANTDNVTARTSQIATQNFFPVVTATKPQYNNGLAGGCGGVDIWWEAGANTPSGQKYQIEEWGNSGTTLMWTGHNSTNTWYNGWNNSGGGGGTHEVRIFGVNATTNERSTGYISFYIFSNSCGKGRVSDTQGQTAVTNWQETTNFTPADTEVVTGFAAKVGAGDVLAQRSAKSVAEPSTSAAPSSEAPKPSVTESAESSAPSPSTSESAESSASSAPSSTPSESTQPSVSEAAPTGVISYGVGIAGSNKGLIIYKDGVEICDFPMAAGDQPSSNSETNTVSVTNGGNVKTVKPETCTLS